MPNASAGGDATKSGVRNDGDMFAEGQHLER